METEIKALNNKAMTPEFIARELLAKAPKIKHMLVIATFESGETAAIRSHQTYEEAALLNFIAHRNTDQFIKTSN